MNPHSFKEEFGNVLFYDTFLVGYQYSHLRKYIDNQKYTVIIVLGGREAR